MESTQFEMADQLKNLREKRKSLEDEAKSVGAEADAVEKRLSDKMTEQEVDRFSRNGSIFYLSSRLFASPRFGDKEGKRFIRKRFIQTRQSNNPCAVKRSHTHANVKYHP